MRSNAQLSVVSPRWSVVGHQTPGANVRRVYKAKLEGRESGHMTVAVYEGDGAEEAWNEHLANYESIRHPNVMQLYGLVSTKRLYAMVFHDELIPYDQFIRRFQHSHILSLYIVDEVLPNSWIRYDSHRTNTFLLELRPPFWEHGIAKAWLAQANCIFAELKETAHIKDYVCIYTVKCRVTARRFRPVKLCIRGAA
ncbi:hypothetical protein MSAN_02379800 [Mycena sanguinolenta]|uniref:Uncharacterized protein n=1 Tax=Mycena sanguinolenta TaxID=230812 RepID=A0A8H6X503_9AGAR|nr:hypothetical protein MSAN_02379800 [Mycena sanguinolenta]